MSTAISAAFSRLVHRLDRETSGALVVARTAAAAAWLSAAFGRKSSAAGSNSGGGSSSAAAAPAWRIRTARSAAAALTAARPQPGSHSAAAAVLPEVQRVYWAIVECGDVSTLQPEGVVEEPLEASLHWEGHWAAAT